MTKSSENGYRWVIAGLAYLSVVSFAFVFQGLPPIVGQLKAALRLSYAQIGVLMGLFSLPGIFLTIPAGLVSDRYGMKRTGILSLLLMVVGTATVALDGGFFTIGVGRVISGIGALTLVIVSAQLLTHWFMDSRLGVAMGFYNTAMPLGTVIAFNTFGVFGRRYGWPAPIWLTMIISLITLVLFIVLYREPPTLREKGREATLPRRGWLKAVADAGLPIWLLGASWLLYNAAAIAFLTFGPEYFASLGYQTAAANFIASFFMLGALAVSPIAGFLIDRVISKEMLIILGGLLTGLILLLTPVAGPYLIVMMLALGLVAALVPAPTFALPADILPPAAIGLGFGIISSCLNIGVVVGPYAVGFLRDQSGSFTSGFILMAAFAFSGVLPIIWLKRLSKAD